MPTAHPEFVDSNVLVYEWDERDPEKQRKARNLIAERRRRLVISTQVLQEVAVTLNRKLSIPWEEVRDIVELYSHLKVQIIEPRLVRQAVETTSVSRLSFWDALIVEAAADANCRVLYSEDFNAGQVIRGVRIVNPFS